MRIIHYDNKYRKKVNEFICSIFVEEFGFDKYRKEILTEDNNKYIENGGNFWIALDEDDNVIGTICIYQKENKIWELKKLYVSATYRGEGIAHKLYDKLLDYAKKNNIKRIELGTYNKMKAAVKFYEKKGFKIIQRETDEEDAIFFAIENI